MADIVKLKYGEQAKYKLLKRSLDARKQVKFRVEVAVFRDGLVQDDLAYKIPVNQVDKAPEVIIVGAGPAGLFAALQCIERGLKPVVLERGKTVRDRRIDLANINKKHLVNEDSNYCFGEGGAGTYSDGKLYTRSKKRGSVRTVLEILVAHGAKSDILIDAHPHIGTNKLPKIIENIRNTILNCGGEIHFNSRVIDFTLKGNEI
ncbi:MAG: NAD(P)/FAD-dependent oxidoreductase, partial [Cyclobacteriaceae bacterium]|nr:NAD(P)/FAD-dependent oxidoreductase [Cyclobacteriaceae bacterium]